MNISKLVATLCAIAAGCFAQGTVNFGNQYTSLIYTNAAAVGGDRGPTTPALGQFRYGLFTAPSTIGTVSVQDLLGGVWSFTGLYATNTAAVTGGRLSGGFGVQTLTGWAPGQTNSFVVAGWSENLGAAWNEVATQLNGALLNGNAWVGANFLSSDKLEFFGLSGVGFAEAGGGSPIPLPSPLLFGAGATPQGTPLTTGFDVYVIDAPGLTLVPEPTFLNMLVAPAALAILRLFHRARLFRRHRG